MKDVARNMDFDVYTDLKDKSKEYNVKIELENEVNPYTRELAIALSGTIVRNYHKRIYESITTDLELADLIKDKLNTWIPKESEFVAKTVTTGPKRVQRRA
jgi:hypothetical protein